MKCFSQTTWVAALLLLSGIALSSLIPGGPIENRDFSAMSPASLLGFNVFLTALGIGSFLLIPAVLQGQALQWRLASHAGLAYVAVYALDLLNYFPQSPDPMSPGLMKVEITGLLLGIALFACARRGPLQRSAQRRAIELPGPLVLLGLIMLAIAVIAFAMHSILGSH